MLRIQIGLRLTVSGACLHYSWIHGCERGYTHICGVAQRKIRSTYNKYAYAHFSDFKVTTKIFAERIVRVNLPDFCNAGSCFMFESGKGAWLDARYKLGGINKEIRSKTLWSNPMTSAYFRRVNRSTSLEKLQLCLGFSRLARSINSRLDMGSPASVWKLFDAFGKAWHQAITLDYDVTAARVWICIQQWSDPESVVV